MRSNTIKNFKSNSDVEYQLGVNVIGQTAVYPDHAAPGQQDDPAGVPIDLASIDYVYLRKQAYGHVGDDDAWQLLRAIVQIYVTQTFTLQQGQYRLFWFTDPNGLWPSNEFGNQVWLTEAVGQRTVPGSLQSKIGPSKILQRLGLA